MSRSPATVVKVGWPAGPAYAGSFLLDSATRGVLDGTTYTLADEILVELAGVLTAKSVTGRSSRYDAPTAGTLTVNLEDPDRELDPTNEAGPWYGAIEARRPISLASRWTVGGTVVDACAPEALANEVLAWLDDPARAQAVAARFDELHAQLWERLKKVEGTPSAAQAAA